MASSEKFLITNWCGVPHKFIRHADGTLAVERFAEALEAGINLIPAYDYGYETNCAVLAACEKLGMRVMLSDDRIDTAVKEPARMRELLSAVAGDYADYPALFGYHITDEPNSCTFPVLGEIRRILSELDPVHEAYINLFPNYASAKALGNPTYYDHLSEFIKTVKPEILSYDHYHFCKPVVPTELEGITDERERMIREAALPVRNRPGFFDNIEDAMAVSNKTGTPFMIIILAVEHGSYRNLTEAEIRWEVFNSLAYGIKRISYFTYWTPGVDWDEGDDFWHWQNGMINKDGTRNRHYEEIARINRELQAMGDILLPHAVKEVFHLGTEPDTKVRYWPGSFGEVTAMTAHRATVGFFEGGYVLLANKDYETGDTVTLTVTPGHRVRLFDKAEGLWKAVADTNGTYALPLAAGDGELIKID